MNPTATILLVNAEARAIRIAYEPDRGDAKNFRILKTFDKSIKPGDFVVVATETRHKMTVVKVEEVDVLWDVDGSDPIGWAIAKVDVERHDALLVQERELIRTVQNAQARRRREELSQDILKDNPDLKSLPLATTTFAGMDTLSGPSTS